MVQSSHSILPSYFTTRHRRKYNQNCTNISLLSRAFRGFHVLTLLNHVIFFSVYLQFKYMIFFVDGIGENSFLGNALQYPCFFPVGNILSVTSCWCMINQINNFSQNLIFPEFCNETSPSFFSFSISIQNLSLRNYINGSSYISSNWVIWLFSLENVLFLGRQSKHRSTLVTTV